MNELLKADIVLMAAGKGERMGHSRNKIFLEIGGVPIYRLTFDAVKASGLFRRIVVAASEADLDDLRKCLADDILIFCKGGATRAASVRNALEVLQREGSESLVFVHDMVRPFITSDFLNSLAVAAQRDGAAAPAVSPVETVRYECEGRLSRLDRAKIHLMQTPQVFHSRFIRECFLDADSRQHDLTDEMCYLERRGINFTIVPGLAENIKITSREDLLKAEIILKNRQEKIDET